MVISVEADVFEVVMFSAGANAFLGVNDTRWFPWRFLLFKKNRHELIHAGIREEQIRRVGQKRRRRHDGVLFLAEEIEKASADFSARHDPIRLPRPLSG